MRLFKVSSSRRKRTYGFPTLRGLLLFAILAVALWFSIFENSEIERWIFISMIFLILVHLIEISQPFQKLHIEVLPLETPFAGEITAIPIQIVNPSKLKVDALSIKIAGSGSWIKAEPVAGNSSNVVKLPYQFPSGGRQVLPKLTLRNRPKPYFFLFWKVIKSPEEILVLPKPIDHNFQVSRKSDFNDDELVGVEEIRDHRYLPMTDQKLLLKTGKPYRRIFREQKQGEQVDLIWFDVDRLSFSEQGEQFSYWLKIFSDKKQFAHLRVSVRSPFMVRSNLRGPLDWLKLKRAFGEWYYDQT